VTGVRHDDEVSHVELSVEAVNQDGRTVVSGTATARIDR
jgi:hypothetical protein